MPNHIMNRIRFECGEEKLKEILTAIQCDEQNAVNDQFGIGTIDFNKIIPTPENIYRGPLGARERELYGKNNWYDWNIENWGTKWNAYSFSHEENEITFHTAWSAPHPILEQLTCMFPGVYITHEWADEDIGNNCGQKEYLNGECVGFIYPESGKEALDLALSVWGYEPEDVCLTLNASGKGYIRTDTDDEYEMISIFGIPGFYSGERMSEEDVPLGFYVYQLRYDDSLSEFATIEPKVAINHAGSIFTIEPLDFGSADHLDLSDRNGISFLGVSLTMREIVESNQENTENMETSMDGIQLC